MASSDGNGAMKGNETKNESYLEKGESKEDIENMEADNPKDDDAETAADDVGVETTKESFDAFATETTITTAAAAAAATDTSMDYQNEKDPNTETLATTADTNRANGNHQQEEESQMKVTPDAEKIVSESSSESTTPPKADTGSLDVGMTSDSDPETSSASSSSKTGSKTAAAAAAAADRPTGQNNVPSAWLQIWALLIKNFWTKLRTPTATCFELLSPLLMMLVLVAAHNLSDILTRDAETYANIELKLPGPWIGLVQSFVGLQRGEGVLDFFSEQAPSRKRERQRRQLWETFGQDQVHIDRNGDAREDVWDSFFAGLSDKIKSVKETRSASSNTISRGLFHDSSSDDEDDIDRAIYELLDDAQRQISELMEGPVPVPSFDQFVEGSLLLGGAFGVENLPRVFSDSSFGRQWGNILTLGTIHLSPANEPIIGDFQAYLNATYPDLYQNSLTLRVHENEEQALQFIDQNLNERTWVLLDFSSKGKQKRSGEEVTGDDDAEEEEVRFTLRMNSTTVPNTNEITNYVAIGLNQRYQMYYLSGFLTLQRTVNEFFMSQEGTCEQAMSDIGSIWSMPMPTAAYNQNPFFLEVGYLLGLTMVMAFLYPTSRLIKTLVEEKETKTKETLFILGLRGWVHWLSWFITSALVFFFITVTCTYALSSNVLKFSDPRYLFAYIGLFASSTAGFCFTLAALFSKAKLAAIIGPMALFATILPRFIFFGYNRYEATTGKMIASLLPSTAFAFGADIIADYEYAEVGVQEWNVDEGDYSFSTTLAFLFFDTILYFFLGWYLEQVMPRDYGSRRPFYFLLTPEYWLSFCVAQKPHDVASMSRELDPEHDATTMEHVDETRWNAGVRICNLFKQYHPGQPPAVNNLNLTLYESQVTSLLGSNGAGKTSTVSILTGLLRPTSGDCVLYGNSIVHDAGIARQSLGICPQHNILFDSLTVTEHLYFFLRIKGIKPVASQVRSSAQEVGLGEFLKTTSIALSGGNKRKLSVAIALCGNPSVLVLDEPTSAMDPHSRRAVWELIRDKRKGRVTFLTTHFMDEAETLSDRIAIMKEGQLQCAGSPLFLKDRFGLGYNLTVVMENEGDGGRNIDGITSFLQSQIPGSKLIRFSGKELSYRFPQGSESLFPDAFDALERERQGIGIGAFGVTNSSLEEVFLELAKNQDDPTPMPLQIQEPSDIPSKNPTSHEDRSVQYLSPLAQIALLYRKRITVQKRDGKGACFSVVVPVIVMALVLLVLMIEPPFVGPSIEVSPILYKTSSDGGIGRTDVIVGSGDMEATEEETLPSNETVLVDFASIENMFETRYDHVSVQTIPEGVTSARVSEFLLDTYNDRDHNVRFGAYVMNDEIDFSITIDWNETRAFLLGEDGDLPANINITAMELANLFYSLTGFNGSSAVDMSNLEFVVQESLMSIFETSSTNATSNAEEWLGALQLAFAEAFTNMEFNATGINIFNLVEGVVEAFSNGTLEEFLDSTQAQITGILDRVGNETFSQTGSTDGPFNSSSTAMVMESVFDRRVVVESYELVLRELYALFGSEPSWNVTLFIESAIDSVGPQIGDDGNSGAASTRQTVGVAGIAPLLLLDNILSTVGSETNNNTLLLLDLFALLSVSFGGSADELDGYVVVNLYNLNFNMETSALEIGAEVTLMDTSGFNISWVSPDGFLGMPMSNTTSVRTIPIRTKASILHNSSSPHAVAAFNQAFLQHAHNMCSNSTKKLRSFNEPLPLTTQQSIEVKTVLSILATLFLLIPFCYIPGAFVVFLVKERICKSKHLQLVSGVNMTSYWVANYLWDLTLFFLLTVLTMCVFLVYGSDSAQVFVGSAKSFFASMVLFFGYGASVLPFSYIFVRNFDNPSSAQISIIGIIFITGFVAVNAYFIMSSLENTKELAESLRPLFRMWPAYNVGEGYINLATAFWEREILGDDGDVFDWDVTGRSLCLLYTLAPVYFLILLLLEYSQDGGSGGVIGMILRNLKRIFDRTMLHWSLSMLEDAGPGDAHNQLEPDQAVTEEAKKVSETKEQLVRSAPIVIHKLWKIYPPSTGFICAICSNLATALCRFLPCSKDMAGRKNRENGSLPRPAVRGTSIAIRQGETLGLLGKNGCGKSTTLNILTGDIAPTRGEAFVAGYSILGGRGVAEARKRIGFCPQTDPLLDLMTGRETLAMFARLRGVPTDRIATTVQNLIDRLTLTPHADKISAAYSGGNKRKLSLGVAALVGDGGALLVDESSSGMDPGARRNMWSLMQELAQRRSVVLTTHSMEEAEALCSRIAVMDRGRFVAMGSVQQLKTKYLDGYTIDMNFTTGTSDEVIGSAVSDLMDSILPGSRIAERYGRFLRFNVDGVSKMGLGTTFRHLQNFKASRACVESYSVSQCTLEQVFLRLVEDSSGRSTGGTQMGNNGS